MTTADYFSFTLSPEFVAKYKDRSVDWGNKDAGGNSLGELTFIDKYSRLKLDGTKERWFETCARVVNGMYTIQKDWILAHHLPWNENKARISAEEAYDLLFRFKWTPPGRGIAQMGAPLTMVNGDSTCLYNCLFVSTSDMTKHNPAFPFTFLMMNSMLGVGVGFDTLGAGKDFLIYQPLDDKYEYVIEDTRESWAESTRLLINSYLRPDRKQLVFDYGLIRPKGSPISLFGGTASGPESLHAMHDRIRAVFANRAGELLTTIDILDLMNIIACAVVAGSSRRSATLALGDPDDSNFIRAKDKNWYFARNDYSNPDDAGWGHASNNSINADIGQDYSPFVKNIALNGEPGLVWLDMARRFGRLKDASSDRDNLVAGCNPCGEIMLESREFCCLSDLHLSKIADRAELIRALKYAYLYAKTVTLLPTMWEGSNAVMQRNRRIGISMSGLADFVDNNGLTTLREWMDDTYAVARHYDDIYSKWLCVRESVKITTVKPTGNLSSMIGVSPGCHWSVGGRYYLRAARYLATNPIVAKMRAAGYTVEPDVTDPNGTVVIYQPIFSESTQRGDSEVSVWEKASLAATAQEYWADNAVSVTLSFNPETETEQIKPLLTAFEGRLKTASFLPRYTGVYAQMPYTEITEEEYASYIGKLAPVDMAPLYEGDAASDAFGDLYCDGDTCLLPAR